MAAPAGQAHPPAPSDAFGLIGPGCDGYKLQLDIRVAACVDALDRLIDPMVSLSENMRSFTTGRISAPGLQGRARLVCVATGRSRVFIRFEQVDDLFETLTSVPMGECDRVKFLVRNPNKDFFLKKAINIPRDIFIKALELAHVSHVVVVAFGQKGDLRQLKWQLAPLREYSRSTQERPWQFEIDVDAEGFDHAMREEGQSNVVLVRHRNPDSGILTSYPLLHQVQAAHG